ncbi:ECF-type sigma factor [Sphingopyxis granuli]|uniref:ECF-type sigma factor n=1 Tax=Sphingopyxis granuli TaxID=267128 RepID=UPI001F52B7C5|nr:ECF-type sigma factor [Sphingopyxis granuli]UNK79202.1 ECF-type sigma factor [Sphingopyxis granuli]
MRHPVRREASPKPDRAAGRCSILSRERPRNQASRARVTPRKRDNGRPTINDESKPAGIKGSDADARIATLYDELKAIARREHYRAGGGQTLQTTALISEAYLKLNRREGWESERHFLGCAATAIRHILIDAARARMTAKRGAGEYAFTESLDSLAAAPEDEDVVRLGEALQRLARLDPNLAQLIDCRFFAGMTEEETAKILGVSDRTVRRWWLQARAWVHKEMDAG